MFSFAKFGPTDYVIHFRQGKIQREGRGLSFFYWVPTSSIVSIPVGSADLPFVFQLLTGDFQNATVQGQLTYRVVEPQKLADLLNFTINAAGRHVSDDPQKLGQRLINEAQTAAAAAVANQTLRDALRSEAIGAAIVERSARVDRRGLDGMDELRLQHGRGRGTFHRRRGAGPRAASVERTAASLRRARAVRQQDQRREDHCGRDR
jgi:hypothetical protein